ncbi:hypothetical protein EDB83DRAFT_2443029 [Lactarius deliciosus]|nr:hypothetical protein EDB83DRAFT_2443029 [Lactarius deliciosus]
MIESRRPSCCQLCAVFVRTTGVAALLIAPSQLLSTSPVVLIAHALVVEPDLVLQYSAFVCSVLVPDPLSTTLSTPSPYNSLCAYWYPIGCNTSSPSSFTTVLCLFCVR